MAATAVLIRVTSVKEWRQPLALHILVVCRVALANEYQYDRLVRHHESQRKLVVELTAADAPSEIQCTSLWLEC